MIDLDTMTSREAIDRNRRRARSTVLPALLATSVAVVSAAGRPAGAEPVVIRLATLMPRQSPWVSGLYGLAARVRKQTRGRVILKIYSGGSAGSEHNSIRLLKQGKLQAVGVTGAMAAAFEPTLRVFELPALMQSDQELSYVYHHMEAGMRKRLWDKGYVLLGMTTLGPIHVFSKRMLSGLKDFRVARLWAYTQDPIAVELARITGARTFRLDITGVLPALKAGIVDTIYSPAHVVLAMGWSPHVAWMLDYRVNFMAGFFVMRKDAFLTLTAQQQKILETGTASYFKEMREKVSRLNARALRVMKRSGLRLSNPTTGLRAYLTRLSQKTWARLQGRTHRAVDLKRVRALLVRCRTTSCRF